MNYVPPDDPSGGRLSAAEAVFDSVYSELMRAWRKFPRPVSSAHEAWAVLREEVDELWDAVKANHSPDGLRAEAVQVAAMAVRFIVEICDVNHVDAPPVEVAPGLFVEGQANVTADYAEACFEAACKKGGE